MRFLVIFLLFFGCGSDSLSEITSSFENSILYNPKYEILVSFYGQSNTGGSGDVDSLTQNYIDFSCPIPGIKYWVDSQGDFQTIDPSQNTYPDARSGFDFGPEVSFAYQLRNRLNEMGISKTVHVLKKFRGGTGLFQDPSRIDLHPNSQYETYNEFRLRIQAAKNKIIANGKVPYFLGLFVFTGETDSLDPAKASNFSKSLQSLFDAFYRDTRSLSVTPYPQMGVVKIFNSFAYSATTRSQIDLFVEANRPLAYSVDADNVGHLDSQHTNTIGTIEVGELLQQGVILN